MHKPLIYATMIFALAPLLAYADSGVIIVGNERISYNTENVTVTDAYFDKDFESLFFETSPSVNTGYIILDLDSRFFAHPAGLDEYYVLIGTEQANVESEITNLVTRLNITVESGVTEIEIFGKLPAKSDDSIQDDQMMDDNMTDDNMTDDKMMDEDMTDDNMTDDKMMDDKMMDDKMMDDKMMDDKMMDDKMTDESDPKLDSSLCGAGTIFDGQTCIVDSSNMLNNQKGECTANASIPIVSCFKDLAYGAGISVIIALFAAVILLLISRASRKN